MNQETSRTKQKPVREQSSHRRRSVEASFMGDAEREQARARLEARMARRQFSTADALLDAGGLVSSDSVIDKRKAPRKSPRGRENSLPPVSLSTYKIPSSSAQPAISMPTSVKFALVVILVAAIAILLGVKACSFL